MPKLALLLLATILPTLLSQSGGATRAAQIELPRTFLSQVAPDLSVVTEVSINDPYVGQQFCILYKLRAQHPPTAVDIDPQQFPGFWTEVIPISQETASTARPLKGQTAVDYLLRQVIAFPLTAGNLQLPPLSLKIKRTGRISTQKEDWDVIGKSDPISMRAIPLPPGPRPDRDCIFVGNVEGSMRWSEERKPALFLEVQGTANLALFQPLDWMQQPADAKYHARLAAAEKSARTIDKEGKRQLTLFQRHRWLIGFSGVIRGQAINDISLPVFEPNEKAWKSSRIEGVQIQNAPLSTRDTSASIVTDSIDIKNSRSLLRRVGTRTVLGLAVFASVLILAFWLRRKQLARDTDAEGILNSLEKNPLTSRRAFLENAQKCLEKSAQGLGRRQNLGADAASLDHCWLLIQRFRFSTEPLPAEARVEILALIRQILSKTESSRQESDEPIPRGFREKTS